MLVVRLHTMTRGQRLSLLVNGERAANLSPDEGWQVFAQPVRLRAGENEIQLALAKRGKVGGADGYALVHSLEIVPGKQAAPAPGSSWPALSPVHEVTVAGRTRAALAGFARLALYVEIPPGAHLEVDTAALAVPAELSISARTFDGKPVTLLHATQAPGAWQSRRVALAAFGDRLVRLELAAPARRRRAARQRGAGLAPCAGRPGRAGTHTGSK